jgi:hypothetical protein
MNPLPFIVTEVAATPAVALEGESEVTDGLGFEAGACVVCVCEFEPPPPQAVNTNAKETTET